MQAPTDVLIVGGGMAGLSTAYYLKSLAPEATTVVLERNARLSEKTRTLNVEGNPMEVGTTIGSSDYHEVLRLADQLGVPHKFINVSISARAENDFRPLARGLLRSAGYLAANLSKLLRYTRLRRDLLERFDAGDITAAEELSLPLVLWLQKHDLERLTPIFVLLVDCFGYGPRDSVPALYPLRSLTPSVVLWDMPRRKAVRLLHWEDLIKGLGRAVETRLSQQVKGADYDETNEIWSVETSSGIYHARHLVIACPPVDDTILDLFEPERRQALGDGLESANLRIFFVKVRGWFSSLRRVMLREVGDPSVLLSARRDTEQDDDGAAFYSTVAQHFPDDMDLDTMQRAVAEEIDKDGAEVLKFCHFADFPTYNLRFTAEALRSGSHALVTGRQGHRNLWLVNSAICAENIREIRTLAEHTANTIAGRLDDRRSLTTESSVNKQT